MKKKMRIQQLTLGEERADEVFPEGYLGVAPRDIFGPRSLVFPLEEYSPSYMTDMFGAGIPEDLHKFNFKETEVKKARSLSNSAKRPLRARKDGLIFDPKDDRVLVENTTMPPWRSVCHIQVVMTNGSTSSGTGWFASSRVVVTAAHCLYDTDGSVPSEIRVTPGLNAQSAPYGAQVSRVVRVPAQWISSRTDDQFDFAMVILPDRFLGNQTGWFGYAVAKDEHLPKMLITSAGYPADFGGTVQVSCLGRIRSFSPQYLFHSIDTVEGQSGSPVFHKHMSGARTVVGIHTDTGDDGQPNKAVRITSAIFEEIADAIKSNP